jgi:phage shock protein A
MAKIEQARRRIEAALDRLEAAVEHAAGAGPASGGAGELDGVRADRDRLAAELATLQQRYDDLKAVTERASERLDQTIERVRGMLGN